MKDFLARSRRLQHTRAYLSSPSVETPAPRNITNEMLQTISGFEQTAPRQFALESQYQPQYGGLNLDLLRQSLFGEPGRPGQTQLNRQAATAQRTGDVADVEALGGRASNAFLAANPRLRSSLDLLLGRTTDSGLLRTLNTQAQGELNRDGALSPDDAYDTTQATRVGYADRGMLMGNPALGAELLARDATRRARRDSGRSFAGTVEGLNERQSDFIGRAAQINASALSDPFMAILGRSSGSGASSGGGRTMVGTGGNLLFDPQNAYAQDVYDTNYNAQASANISNANNQAATNNAAIGAGSAIAAAAIIAL